MEKTRLWNIVQRMPKGALLHCHLGAMVDLRWVFEETLKESGMCMSAPEPLVNSEVRERAAIKFAFSKSPCLTESIWLSDYVANEFVPVNVAADSYPDGGREGWVKWMQDRCSITQTESVAHHLGVDDVWRKLNSAFTILPCITYYEPIMRRFVREFFRTLVADGVRWLEFRAAPFTKFVLEGQEEGCGDPGEFVRLIDEEIHRFMKSDEGKGFWGIRMIWVGMRHWADDAVIKGNLLHTCIE